MKNKIFGKASKVFKCSTIDKQTEKSETTEKTPVKEELERCVICGKLTYIPVSMPIELRENYAIGMGQICDECAKKSDRKI